VAKREEESKRQQRQQQAHKQKRHFNAESVGKRHKNNVV